MNWEGAFIFAALVWASWALFAIARATRRETKALAEWYSKAQRENPELFRIETQRRRRAVAWISRALALATVSTALLFGFETAAGWKAHQFSGAAFALAVLFAAFMLSADQPKEE